MDWEAFHNGLVSGWREGAPGFVMQKEGRLPHPRTPSTPTCVWPDSPRSGGWRWSIGPGIRSSILEEEREAKSWGVKSWGGPS